MIEALPLDVGTTVGPWTVFVGIILATFVSEDLTCVAVGVLLAAGRVDWLPGLAGCAVGIVLGDLGVWLVGRSAGRRVLCWPWVRRRLSEDKLARMSDWLSRRGGRAALMSRFLPGTRVPLFLAAGVLGHGGARFLAWAVLAALLWAPALVLAAALLGEAVAASALRAIGSGWIALAGIAAAGWVGSRLVTGALTRHRPARLAARVSRLWRWEFWPAWVFYLPLVPWYLLLSVRYRSLTVWTAANPGIPAGGVVGESKADILAKLPKEWVVPTVMIPPGAIGDRLRLTLDAVVGRDWEYPLILKPDAGQRGAGVKKAHDAVDVEKYLLVYPGAVIAQPFHPGPYEAGVFYYRHPGESVGRVFSVTDKVFPIVIGDGRSTMEELVWAHPRYRMQAATFLARHAAEIGRVLAAEERFQLALAGNHCQGTLFRDGGHLVTPALERTVDAVARSFDGFHVGRFDIRYHDPDEFRAGRGFAVVELNGATSESTNLYDPSWPLWRAYRTLFRQWALLFRIGHENCRRGHRPVALRGLVALLLTYYRDRSLEWLAD